MHILPQWQVFKQGQIFLESKGTQAGTTVSKAIENISKAFIFFRLVLGANIDISYMSTGSTKAIFISTIQYSWNS